MAQSLARLYVHLIFSTKNRRPFLDDAIRTQAHGFLAALFREMESPYVVVGGVADHVHILFDMGKMRSLVDFVEDAKRKSSLFIKTLGPQYHGFYWQRGYGAFSVSPTHKGEVEKYIAQQAEHHQRKSFQDEFREFLRRYEVEHDERFVWD